MELRGRLPGWNVVQMWLAKVRQQEYDKKEARLGTIDKRLRSETGVRVREREYRKARCAAASLLLCRTPQSTGGVLPGRADRACLETQGGSLVRRVESASGAAGGGRKSTV